MPFIRGPLVTLPTYPLAVAPLQRKTLPARATGLGVGVGEFKASTNHFIGVIENRAAKVEGGFRIYQNFYTRSVN